MRWTNAVAAAAATLLPGTAWACGACTDNLVRTSAWYGPWPTWALAALLADAIGFAVYAKVRLLPPAKKSGFLGPLLGVLFFVVGLGFLGLYLSSAILAIALLAKTIRSRARLADRSPPERWAVVGVRLAATAAIVAAFVVSSVPSAVPSATLLSNLLYKGPRLDPPGWCEKELKRRNDLATVTAALDKEVASSGQFLTSHAGHLLRLHEFMGGPATARKAACNLLRAQGEKASPTLAKACLETTAP